MCRNSIPFTNSKNSSIKLVNVARGVGVFVWEVYPMAGSDYGLCSEAQNLCPEVLPGALTLSQLTKMTLEIGVHTHFCNIMFVALIGLNKCH